VGQAFADIATLSVVHAVRVSTDQARARLHDVLTARDVVEQAKGVIAHVDDVDLATAYRSLISRAEKSGETLTEVAQTIVRDQYRGPSTT
jgi:AmiR/NasT family two-component response regulator